MASYQHQKYTEIPVLDEAPVSIHAASGRRFTVTSIVVFGLISAMAIVGFVTVVSPTNKGIELDFELEGAANPATRSCSFKECVAAGCDHSDAPFVCLFHNGGPHGGCSSTPWDEWSCSESCDLSGCDALDFPEDVESCESVTCPDDWCSIGQLCGPDVPYQCLEGAGRFGCSDDSYHWTLYGCSCCDASTCL